MVATGIPLHTTPPPAQPNEILREFEDALKAGDLVKGIDLATRLDEEVQLSSKASLVSDATQRIDETLAWLPPDIESLFVLQDPVVVDSRNLQVNFSALPARFYALDRLVALDEGRFLQQLDGRTIQLTIAAMKNARTRGEGAQVPALMPDGDAAYFYYYFSSPIEAGVLRTSDQKADAHPIWECTAQIDAGDRWTPGMSSRPMREDHTWLALPRPDLLVAASTRSALLALLAGIESKEPPEPHRALPATLPEWRLADHRAPFWGFRHFSQLGDRRDLTNPQCLADGSSPDPLLRGLAVRFDVDTGTVETQFVHAGALPPSALAHGNGIDYKAEKDVDGTRRLRSNIRERGPFPFHLALSLLGFGGYR